jgi:uncharacterized protein (TIGR04168 family)
MHQRRRSGGARRRLLRDGQGTIFFNAACVPRHGVDSEGRRLRHLSWVCLRNGRPERLSHRWYGCDGQLLYEQMLWQAVVPSRC